MKDITLTLSGAAPALAIVIGYFHAGVEFDFWLFKSCQTTCWGAVDSVVLSCRHGTISNFCSISISIFSEILFSKSISISKSYKQFFQYQNQYQYQNFPNLNIKINIKIFQNPESISKSISISSKYWYWYWKSKFFGP